MVLRDRDSDANGSLDERLYAVHDANFNVTAVVGDDGSGGWEVVERYLYDPYGERTVLDADWSSDADGLSDVAWQHGHQGGRHSGGDAAGAGLVNFRFREMDTSLGRWTRQDPAGYVDGANLFHALKSDPVSSVDSQGLATQEADDHGGNTLDEEGKRAMAKLALSLNMVGIRGDWLLTTWFGVVGRCRERSAELCPGEENDENGPADAFRHCYFACLGRTIANHVRQTSGRFRSIDAGMWTNRILDIKEESDDRKGQASRERQMDDHNNDKGNKFGKDMSSNGRDADVRRKCEERCKSALDDGDLDTF
jgi:RHS repeat-associated protein